MKMTMGVALPTDRSRGRLFENLGKSWWVDLNGGDLPQPILVRLRTSPEGSLVCTGLIIGAFADQEISARDLREIRLGEILENFSSLLAAHKKDKATRELGRVTVGDLLEFSAEHEVARTTLPPGPLGHSREHFELVAKQYRAALVSDPRRPIQRVAQQHWVSEATVHRWLQRCRELGIPIPGTKKRAPKRKQQQRGRKK